MKFKVGDRVCVSHVIQRQLHLPFDPTIGTIIGIEKGRAYNYKVIWDDGMDTQEREKNLILSIEPNQLLKEVL